MESVFYGNKKQLDYTFSDFKEHKYPILKILKINKLNLPVGIKITPDEGINPFFNRESLEYTTLCKTTILQRIKEVSEWFINKYNETCKEFKDIHHIKEYYSNHPQA